MNSPEKFDKPITVMYLIDTCISPPDNPKAGGAEKQLYLLFTSLASNIFKPIVVQLSPHKSLPVATGSIKSGKVFHLPTQKFYNLNGLRQLRCLFTIAKQSNVDIIHTFFEKSEVMGWLTGRFCGIPIWITSRRDLGFKRRNIYNKFFSFVAQDCKRCLANCQAIKDHLVQKEKVAEEKIEVIYNGLNFLPYQQLDNGNFLRNELGFKDHVPLVGMVANFYLEIKGHHYFLKAAKTVLEKIPDVKFLLIGEGFLRSQFEKMAYKLGISEKVHFLGRRGDVPAILSNLTVSVLSSTSEGLSNVILESMAAGKPIVATDVGGTSEIIINEVTGYLVPPEDPMALAEAITALLKDPNKAMTMGEAGRKLVREKFTIKAMVESHENLYKSLMAEAQQNSNT